MQQPNKLDKFDTPDENAPIAARPRRIDISGISRETQAKLALYRNLTGLTNAQILDKLLTEALPVLLRERGQRLI